MRLTTWWVGAFIILIIIAGATTDILGKIQTYQQAFTIAQGAARAGTNAATGTSVNGDAFNLSGPMAVTAAQNYLASAGITGKASVAGDTVTVTVEMTYTPHMLGALGPLPVHATGSAKLIGN